jgi:hypothetical protein
VAAYYQPRHYFSRLLDCAVDVARVFFMAVVLVGDIADKRAFTTDARAIA